MKKAFSLSITLWISVILMAGAIFFLNITKNNLNNTKKLYDKLDNAINANSTLELLKFYIASSKFQRNKIINHNMDNFLPTELSIDNNEELFNSSLIKLQDTAGLINLFNVNINIIKRLLLNNNVKNESVASASLKDWLDTNDFHILNGAEKDYYTKFTKYKPRNTNYIEYIDEVLNIKGWDKKVLKKLRKYFVYTTRSSYNYTTMPSEILESVYDFNKKEAQSLIKLRNKNINNFIERFITLDKKSFNFLSHNTFPSRIIKFSIINQSKNSSYKIEGLIDFSNWTTLYITH